MDTTLRLAEILAALEGVGANCLVMGGHAARYYGVNRTTNDFDLHVAPDGWADLAGRLSRSSLFAGRPLVEGPSWRLNDFRRFQIGTLADGREEWLEFWRQNHLLPPFAELFARREEGMYGGRRTAFLSLPDLIRSKETERESDWLDIGKLEEILDARLVANAESGSALVAALARVRSRSGLQGHLAKGHLVDTALIERAIDQASSPIAVAWLLPLAPGLASRPFPCIEPILVPRLAAFAPGSEAHSGMVEVVRRRYKATCQDADRANKQTVRASQGSGETPLC